MGKIKLAIRILSLINFFSIGMLHPVLSQEVTYAERLGYPKGARVLILHIDDVGMSWDSNEGAFMALEQGVANSLSVMMPCPWVAPVARYLKEHPKVDAGLHLTLTSEWRDYRWHPLSGRTAVPGLIDNEGAMWRTVEQVAVNAKADEIETEIREQLLRARTMGFEPTHLDSHMGTLFATPAFMERYIKVGIENKIPVMFPGGHNTMIGAQRRLSGEQRAQLQAAAKQIWDAGLPVLDDLHNVSGDFVYPDQDVSDAELKRLATQSYIESIRQLKPGISMVIMHCTWPSEIFKHISHSGKVRKADVLAMTDPEFKKFLNEEKIILTTWRELKQRRDNLKTSPKK